MVPVTCAVWFIPPVQYDSYHLGSMVLQFGSCHLGSLVPITWAAWFLSPVHYGYITCAVWFILPVTVRTSHQWAVY